MSDNEVVKKYPISAVRYGMGKEIQLYKDELVVTSLEEGHEIRLPLQTRQNLPSHKGHTDNRTVRNHIHHTDTLPLWYRSKSQ